MIRRGAIDSWFFNHKVEYLFYEAYLEPASCKRLPGVVPDCDVDGQLQLLKTIINANEHVMHHYFHGKHTLVSLVDGFAFDMDVGMYCKVSE